MNITRLVSVALMLGVLAVGGASAQSSRENRQPAEFPPSSYKGKQYVDSKGCVFIRAGIDGNVSWIPRVARNRKSVCGFKPSLAGQMAEAVPAPAPAKAPVKITNPTPVAQAPVNVAPEVAFARPAPVRVAAVPKPRQAVAPAPQPRVVRQTAPVRVVRQPVTVARAPAAIVELPTQRTTTTPIVQQQPVCRGASAISSQYINSNSRYPVRCGPQQAAIQGVSPSVGSTGATTVYTTRRAAAPAPVTVHPDTRIVPKHVAIRRQNTTNVQIPAGYKRVWKDDRLNPYRAEQSLAGHQQMQLVWTSTVPRRLINQANGRDVTASVALVYPFTDFTRQQRDLGEVTIARRDGKIVKRIVRNRASSQNVVRNRASAARQPTYSSRSTPKTTAPQARAKAETLSGNRYVQVGTFADANNAQTTARRLQQMGLPARIGQFNRSGRTLRVVVAGPFGSDGTLSQALRQVRSAGFSDAYARR